MYDQRPQHPDPALEGALDPHGPALTSSPTSSDHLPAARSMGQWASADALASTVPPRVHRTDYLLAIGIALSCFMVIAVLVAIVTGLLAETNELDDEAVESIVGLGGLGALALGAIVGVRGTSLAGVRAWLVVTVGAFAVMVGLVGIGDWLNAASDGLLPTELAFYAVLVGTMAWLLVRQRDRSSRTVAAIAITASLVVALALLAVGDRTTEWFGPAIAAASVTAILIAWGIAAQRSRPDRRWPVLAVGLAAGLVAGLAMLQASWAEGRWPHRRKFTDAMAASVGALLVLVAVWTASESPFGIGPAIDPGDIERPTSGYAMSLPDPWRIEDVSAEAVLFGEEVPVGTGVDLMAVHGDGEAFALVIAVDEQLDFSPKETASLFRMSFSLDAEYSNVQSEVVALPAGDTARVDAVYKDGTAMSVYIFPTSDHGYLMLQILADELPEDRWRSVAETFALLPPLEEATVAR